MKGLAMSGLRIVAGTANAENATGATSSQRERCWNKDERSGAANAGKGGALRPRRCRPVLRRVMAVGDPVDPLNGNPVRARQMAAAAAAKAAAADAAMAVMETRPLQVAFAVPETLIRPRPEMAFYRRYTQALLQKYAKMSMNCASMPSLLGKELFRGRVSHYKVQGFDDMVIFCADVEKCLDRLLPEECEVLKRVCIQGYTLQETTCLVGIGMATVTRKYNAALDRLTGMLLSGGLMQPLKSCQGGWRPKQGLSA
jgi:predicted DNA-binding protein (UPF0251 family)